MGIFKRSGPTAAPVQLRCAESHPFGVLDGYVPLRTGEMRLYRAIREAVPIIDAAIVKIVRLTGGFDVKCADAYLEQELREFLRNVNVGRGQRGLQAFLDQYLDSMLVCGRGIGEIVPYGRESIAAVLCGDPEEIEIREGDSPLDYKLCIRAGAGEVQELPYQELLLFSPHSPEAANPYGVSLLRSMPFLADILLRIYNTIGTNWDRAGNVRFAVVYKPQGDVIDRAYARERSEQIASEWSKAMQSTKAGAVRDFVAVGDVDIKVIGADDKVLDSEVPVRQILEQLVAKTGIPPFMLGLSWAATERMSTQQADMLTSELTALRRSLTPVIERVVRMWLSMNGSSAPFEVVWDEINLQDKESEAHAELYMAQAELYRAQAKGSEQSRNEEV